jgi:hypothetical protein
MLPHVGPFWLHLDALKPTLRIFGLVHLFVTFTYVFIRSIHFGSCWSIWLHFES